MSDVEVRTIYIFGGLGVFATRDFAAGETVLVVDASRVVDEARPLRPEAGERAYHCDLLPTCEVVLLGAPERHLNLYDDFNVEIRPVGGRFHLVALERIFAGEELTLALASRTGPRDPAPRASSVRVRLRNYLDALDRGDPEPFGPTALGLRVSLEHLLLVHLESTPDWDGESRWIDGVYRGEYFRGPDESVRLLGTISWGPREDEAGPWGDEMFEACATIAGGRLSYRLWFGGAAGCDARETAGAGVPPLMADTARPTELAGGEDARPLRKFPYAHSFP